jgi:hypothetical protein
MKISIKKEANGTLTRHIDFEGAKLPNGRSMDEILNENVALHKQVEKFTSQLEESTSILVRLVPKKRLRNIIEILLIIMTIVGAVLFFL